MRLIPYDVQNQRLRFLVLNNVILSIKYQTYLLKYQDIFGNIISLK